VTKHSGPRLEHLVADLEIRRVLTDYAACVDARDFDQLRQVFADDVLVDYHNGRTVVAGGDDVVAYIRDNTAHLAWQHHFVSVYGVDVDGDGATAQVYLLSHQVVRAEPTHVLMMAARYQVSLQHTDRWRISHMVHTIQLANFHAITVDPPIPVEIPDAVRPGLA
jgi:ketosteroid isomerase-like protein